MSATGDEQAGFTLLEMLTVLAISALIGTIAFPRLEQGAAAASLAQARRSVTADLLRTRAAAIRTGVATALVLSPDGRTYGWSREPDHTLPGDARLEAKGGARIAFFPDGSASGGRLVLSTANRRIDLDVETTGWVNVSAEPRP